MGVVCQCSIVPKPLDSLNTILCLHEGGLEAAVCICVCQNSVFLVKPICAAEGGWEVEVFYCSKTSRILTTEVS